MKWTNQDAKILTRLVLTLYVLVFLFASTGFVLGCDVAHLVEVLHYMSEGHVFDLPWCHWDFSLA